MTARLGLIALGILAALGLAEGVLRVATVLDPRVRFLATGRATRPAVTCATLEEFIAAQAAHITPHNRLLREYARTRGIPLVDLTPVFAAESVASSEALYKRSDNHWTPRGNRAAARSLTAFLAPLVCAPR